MPDAFHCIPDRFKTQEMCDKAVWEDSSFLQFVPDWFITREWVDMCYDDYYDDDVVIGMMMMRINFLSGIMAIKNGRFKKPL